MSRAWWVFLLVCSGWTGCQVFGGPVQKPRQVDVEAVIFPALNWDDVSKVVVLPLMLEDAVAAHADVVQREIVLAFRQQANGRFAPVTPQELGRTAAELVDWRNQVPMETLIQVHRDFGADAALFGTLTFSRSYGDPALGLRVAMVDARNGELLWFAEDVIDSHEPSVREALEGFWEAEAGQEFETLKDASYVPMTTFARFVATSFAAAMPFGENPIVAEPAREPRKPENEL